MESKTIIFSANTSWYLYNFRSSTIKRFIALDHKVICVSPYDNYSAKLTDYGAKHIDVSIDSKGLNPFRDLILIWNLFLIYRKLSPDLIFHFTIKNNIYGSWAASLARKKFINNITGLGTIFINDNLISKLVYLLYKSSQPFAERIFCQNNDDYSLLIKNNLVPEKKLYILPGSGVDLEKFHPRLLNRGLKTDSFCFRFVYCGRMIADKGLFELIEAVMQINQSTVRCNLWLCGFIDEKNHSYINPALIESWAKQSYIDWIGPTENVSEVLSECNCLILPSYREGLPRSILEACAMSLPVIASDVPGCRDIISDNHNGFLCNPKDSKSLQSAMLKMLSISDSQREEMGKNGRQRVEKEYNESIVINSAIMCLDEISNN
jgi:glycosyltransferase involved in cell wall biosynthesis